MSKRFLSRSACLAATLALAGCSTFGPAPLPAPRGFDLLHDDIGGLLIAFDLPRGIGPMPNASTLSYAVPNAPPLRLKLVPTDGENLANRLPPPGNGRAYYFFAVSPADQGAARAAQAAARREDARADVAGFAVFPGLCSANGQVDPSSMKISVLAATSSGGPISPLIDRQKLVDFIGPAGNLPACP